MARAKTQFRCSDCSWTTHSWVGRCGGCGSWATLTEEPLFAPADRSGPAGSTPVELCQASSPEVGALETGIGELDRVLGGGLTPSSVTLFTGEPGIGKSTLLLQMLARLAQRGVRCLLVSAEESVDQVRRRASRLSALVPELWVTSESDLSAIRQAVANLQPAVLVVDSIQTVCDRRSDARAGTVTAVRDSAAVLAEDAKAGGPATVLVGHVTKDGSIAGPRILEHLVDTVLSFEGDRLHGLRSLRGVKHRFGSVGEVGIWEMTGAGLIEVPDAAGLLLADRQPGMAGSVVLAAMDGRRPLLVEVQALVAEAGAGAPRRSAHGLDPGRLSQVLAVLDRRYGVPLRDQDVYVSVVGGVRLTDPGADLAVAAAITSSFTGLVAPDDVVVAGEIGLGGELRQVAAVERRLEEAARMGFRSAVVPPGGVEHPALNLSAAATLGAALDQMLQDPVPQLPRLRALPSAGSG